MVVACGAVAITVAFEAPPTTLTSGRAVSAVASGVVTFSDLIAQDLRRPRIVVERVSRRRSADPDARENPSVDAGFDHGSPVDRPSAFDRPAAPSTGSSPVPAATFGAVQGSSTVPPDSTGAVGPAQVLTVTNHGLQAHTKTGAFLGAVSTWTFWGMFNPAFPFDPRVIYDPVQQRFVVIALDYRSSGQVIYDSSIYVAVSHTGDLLGGWTLRKYLAGDTVHPNFVADFPMVGLSQNFLAVTVVGNRTFVFSYPALRQTQGQAPVTVLDAAGPGYLNSWGAPAVSSSPTEGGLYFVKSNLGAAGDFRLNRLTGPPDAPSFISGPLVALPSHLRQVGCVPFSGVNQAPEPGTGNTVILPPTPGHSDAVFRDDYLWFTESRRVQATDCGGHARVLWLKLHKSGTFADGGVIEDPAGKWFMYPTIAVNRYHDVLVGFTQTSSMEYASAAYAFREATDPAGTMRDARVYKPGEGHFNLPYAGGVGRWGDYSHTVVDPSDDTTLWTIQEYARAQVGTGAGSGRWGTRRRRRDRPSCSIGWRRTTAERRRRTRLREGPAQVWPIWRMFPLAVRPSRSVRAACLTAPTSCGCARRTASASVRRRTRRPWSSAVRAPLARRQRSRSSPTAAAPSPLRGRRRLVARPATSSRPEPRRGSPTSWRSISGAATCRCRQAA